MKTTKEEREKLLNHAKLFRTQQDNFIISRDTLKDLIEDIEELEAKLKEIKEMKKEYKLLALENAELRREYWEKLEIAKRVIADVEMYCFDCGDENMIFPKIEYEAIFTKKMYKELFTKEALKEGKDVNSKNKNKAK